MSTVDCHQCIPHSMTKLCFLLLFATCTIKNNLKHFVWFSIPNPKWIMFSFSDNKFSDSENLRLKRQKVYKLFQQNLKRGTYLLSLDFMKELFSLSIRQWIDHCCRIWFRSAWDTFFENFIFMYCTYDGYFNSRACFRVSKLVLAVKTNSPDPLPTSSLLLAKNNRLIWN